MAPKLVSVFDGGHLRSPLALGIESGEEDMAFTLEGLVSDNVFVRQINGLLGDEHLAVEMHADDD